jgi:pimeloyl-ACP methyl ester carboxylesterase
MKPVLLLLPGMLNDAGIWDDVAAVLHDAVDVRTMPPLTQESVPAMARAAWERVADVPPGVPLLVAGFSLGGYVTLEMLAHPARELAGAALVSTSARPESPESAANREKTIAGMQADFAKVVDGILKWGTHAPSAQVLQRLRAMMLQVGAPTAIGQSRAIMGRGDHRTALAQVAMPVAVLSGRQDRITPPALSEELAALLPRARLTSIDEAGHMLPAEQPAAVAAVLKEWSEHAAATATFHNQGDK